MISPDEFKQRLLALDPGTLRVMKVRTDQAGFDEGGFCSYVQRFFREEPMPVPTRQQILTALGAVDSIPAEAPILPADEAPTAVQRLHRAREKLEPLFFAALEEALLGGGLSLVDETFGFIAEKDSRGLRCRIRVGDGDADDSESWLDWEHCVLSQKLEVLRCWRQILDRYDGRMLALANDLARAEAELSSYVRPSKQYPPPPRKEST